MNKYFRAGQTTDDNTALCALHPGYLRLQTHTHRHTEYAILIAFPLQQWLLEGTSVLRYTYTVLLLYNGDNVFPARYVLNFYVIYTKMGLKSAKLKTNGIETFGMQVNRNFSSLASKDRSVLGILYDLLLTF
jgi:hypothetical protein